MHLVSSRGVPRSWQLPSNRPLRSARPGRFSIPVTIACWIAFALVAFAIQYFIGGGEVRAQFGAVSAAPAAITVIDGDTIRVAGEPRSIRLVGFNAPETRDAACADEADLGSRATERLKQLLQSKNINLTKIACACRPGTEGTSACNYGRGCAVLKADGRDVGATLIAEGLAVGFRCGATRCPPTPRPWCSHAG
jgi:endonuclease YncB( thermonuclease family)